VTWCLVTFLPKIRREDSSKIQYSTEKGNSDHFLHAASMFAWNFSKNFKLSNKMEKVAAWFGTDNSRFLGNGMRSAISLEVVWEKWAEIRSDLGYACIGGDLGISMAKLAVRVDLLVQMVPCVWPWSSRHPFFCQNWRICTSYRHWIMCHRPKIKVECLKFRKLATFFTQNGVTMRAYWYRMFKGLLIRYYTQTHSLVDDHQTRSLLQTKLKLIASAKLK